MSLQAGFTSGVGSEEQTQNMYLWQLEYGEIKPERGKKTPKLQKARAESEENHRIYSKYLFQLSTGTVIV